MGVRRFAPTASLAAAMLAAVPHARSRGALWCLPAVAENAARLAEACGRPLAPGAMARVARIRGATSAAVERVKGTDHARRWQAEFQRMSAPSPPAVTAERCAAQLSQFSELLDQTSDSDEGEALVRRVESEAAMSGDPISGLCL